MKIFRAIMASAAAVLGAHAQTQLTINNQTKQLQAPSSVIVVGNGQSITTVGTGSIIATGGVASSIAWGNISGTLSNQTDLNTALGLRVLTTTLNGYFSDPSTNPSFNAAAWRTDLSLGGAALLNVGTTAGTVAAGDDLRFYNLATNAQAVAGTSSTTIISPSTLSYSRPLGTGLAALEAAGFQYLEHRGLPLVYPEETMDAYRASVSAGARVIEADCQLLRDKAIAIMHDTTLTRTTTSTGSVSAQTSANWKRIVVDSSVFLGGGWYDSIPPFLDDILREFGNKIPLHLEAKTGGSGTPIASALIKYGISRDMAMVTSFGGAPELSAAIAAGYPAMLLVANYTGSPTPAEMVSTGYRWLGTSTTTSTAQMDAVRAAGIKVAIYTVNTITEVTPFLSHSDAAYSDDAIYLRSTGRLASDPFVSQTWYHGHQASNATGDGGGRGAFFPPNLWGFDMSASNTWVGALMGWASPIGGGATLPSVTITFSVVFESAFTEDRFLSLSLLTGDRPFTIDIGAPSYVYGFSFVCKKNGDLLIYRYIAGTGTAISSVLGTAIIDGATATYKITVTPSDLTLERTDVATTTSIAAADYRGPFLHANIKGAFAKLHSVSITIP